MKIKRIMIAAPKSGSGKTTITCALLQALRDRGQQAVSYKCGPDYIDPMFHEKVIGIPSRNLDTFFTNEEQTARLFFHSAEEGSFAVLEGVMGLFDGLGGVREEGSSYHLAKVTKTPIVLVVDAKGMGRSLIALLTGFLACDKEHLICGVILNRISGGYFEVLKPLIEEELKLPVLGYLPEKKELCIGNRHLGLILPDELGDLKEKLRAVSRLFQETVSMDAVMEAAEGAEVLEDGGILPEGKRADEGNGNLSAGKEKTGERSGSCGKVCGRGEKKCIGLEGKYAAQGRPVIAVAKDEAFCFYYADNLRLLEAYGAELEYFSPLHDEKLPDKCHALLLGGGYPELYAGKLGRNVRMCDAVRRAVKNGMPIVAECGGFMYLHSAVIDREGKRHEMAGVLPAVCFDTGKLVRFGYIEMREKQSYFLPEGERIRGHEFHYYDSEENGEDVLAVKPVTGKEYSCIMEGENYWMGFPHLYYPSNPAFAGRFAAMAERYRHLTENICQTHPKAENI